MNQAPIKKKVVNFPIPQELVDISQYFFKSNKKFYLVGGCVRDVLLNKPPKDYDVATNATPDEVLLILKDKYKMLEVGKSFGVIVVVAPSGEEYEIATLRSDGDSSDGRRPDSIQFTTIDKDVLRRDLTINALFYDLETQEIVDYVGGIEDIKNNVVKTVGEPTDRFNEDKLRILRAIRFAARLGSSLDKKTSESIRNDNDLSKISHERIKDEFIKGINSAKSIKQFVSLINEYDLFKFVFPGLSVIVENAPEVKNYEIVIAMLLLENPNKLIMDILNKIKYSNDEVLKISFLNIFAKAQVENSIVRLKKAYKGSKINENELMQFCSLIEKQVFCRRFLQFNLSVSPQSLIDQGFSGKLLGEKLEQLEQQNWLNFVKK